MKVTKIVLNIIHYERKTIVKTLHDNLKLVSDHYSDAVIKGILICEQIDPNVAHQRDRWQMNTLFELRANPCHLGSMTAAEIRECFKISFDI